MVKEYKFELSVNKNAKLSLHPSGFVQLSGDGIISGTDVETGEIKGVGVFSAPFSNPVNSGPTFGISFWGIEKGFKKLIRKTNNTQYIILDAEDGDFIKRISMEDFKTLTHTVEFFSFP